jgi:hypothetical protein
MVFLQTQDRVKLILESAEKKLQLFSFFGRSHLGPTRHHVGPRYFAGMRLGAATNPPYDFTRRAFHKFWAQFMIAVRTFNDALFHKVRTRP